MKTIENDDIRDYGVITAVNADDLVKLMQEALQGGWQPYGAPFIDNLTSRTSDEFIFNAVQIVVRRESFYIKMLQPKTEVSDVAVLIEPGTF